MYHIAREAGTDKVLDALLQMLPITRHIQFADAPGRHEPGTGKIDFSPIFAAIDASAYDGWAAAEYLPEGKTVDGLDWLAQFA